MRKPENHISCTPREIFIGVDGGGTHTRACVVDSMNQVLGWGQGGPSNLNYVSEETVFVSLQTAISGALEEANLGISQVADSCFALAGAEGERNLERLSACLQPLGFGHQPMLVEDTRAALAAALDGRDGVAVIAGTGSNCLGVKDGRYARAGGYGALLGDEGSGYRIALSGLTAVLRAFDGRDGHTDLEGPMLEATGARSPMDFVHITLGMEREATARLAQVVFQVAGTGDPAARGRLETGAEALVEMAVAVSRRLGIQGPEVALAGGCFMNPLYVSIFKDKLAREDPGASARVSTRPAAHGAAGLAIDRYTNKNP